MISRLRRLPRYLSTSYFQKNHKADFTANRINERFIHLHLDYLEMSADHYDERLIVNIYIKAL